MLAMRLNSRNEKDLRMYRFAPVICHPATWRSAPVRADFRGLCMRFVTRSITILGLDWTRVELQSAAEKPCSTQASVDGGH